MSTLEKRKIVVVGGGPGGLTLARLLQMQGADVCVYERDADRSARVQGSALDLHPDSGLAALETAGLMHAFWPRVRPELNRLRLVDPDATVLYDFARGAGSGVHRPEIERGPLRELLLDSLEPGTVHWNKKLEAAIMHGDRVQLQFADGETVVADLAVGADGANSRLRPLVTPIRPAYAGVTLIEGQVSDGATAVPTLWAMLDGAALIALGAEQTLAMATKSDGSLLFYAGLRAPAPQVQDQMAQAHDAESRVRWFRLHFPQWSAVWEPLFARTTQLIWRPQHVCPFDQRWDAQRCVTLLGDAAHVMPPYAGEGVNMAMLDALVLSRALVNQADQEAAIASYQREMFARTAQIATETMANTERFYAPDAGAQVVAMFQGFARMAAAGASPVSDLPN